MSILKHVPGFGWVRQEEFKTMKKPTKKSVKKTVKKPLSMAERDLLSREYLLGFEASYAVHQEVIDQAVTARNNLEKELAAVRNELVVSRQTSEALEANRDQLINEMNVMEAKLLKRCARLRALLDHSIDQE